MNIINKIRDDESFRTLCLTILSCVFLIASFFKLFTIFSIDPAWVAILISGTPIVFGAIKGLVTEFDVTADVLVAIALVAAVTIGENFAAGEVAFIMQLGKVLEDVTANRTHKGLQTLIKLTPQKACLRTPEGDKEILAADVKAGDTLLVRLGETIPVDGKIIRGSTSVDQSVMTGESMPVDKAEGDDVYQGTMNRQGSVDIIATKIGEESSLKKMIRLVEEAEDNKAPIVRVADKWARILVPVALACSLLIWLITKDIYRAVTALVVFCPCSLILATPTAMMAAIGNATKKGILIKSGLAVETAAKASTLVMDKTGTMTYGRLQVEELHLATDNIDAETFLKYIASAEKFSEHPMGKSIINYAQSQSTTVPDPDSFEAVTGKGIIAVVDGHDIRIGEKLVDKAFLEHSPAMSAYIHSKQEEGKTVLPVMMDGKLLGSVVITDILRKETRDTIQELKRSFLQRIVMLTGDNETVAKAIGKAAGITEIFASQLPEDKVNNVKRLKEQGQLVAMLGDGVNDAPALATADVGIVMGAIGSDVAIETADIALMNDDIAKLPFLFRLCRKTRARIVFNIIVSMFINFGAIILAGFGILNPVTAALVHNFGSVFVVVSSALLLSYREEA